MNRATWHLRANAPVIGWIVAVLCVALLNPLVPHPRWLMVHLLLLGAVTNAIMVWSRHFADALLRGVQTADTRRRQAVRLVGVNAGTILVVGGVIVQEWSLTAVGAGVLVAAVGWHGLVMASHLRRALPSRFGSTVRYYVVATAALALGATTGAILGRGVGDPLEGRLELAHETLNLLGWVGLTVVGTLITLWPTMLRTRVAEGSERAANRALLILASAVFVIAGSALTGLQWGAVAGLTGYLVGLGVAAKPMAAAAVRRRPSSYPTWSVLAGFLWLVGSLVIAVLMVALAPGWPEITADVGRLTVPLAAGFVGQVLLGALSYLVPVVLGGGPVAVRATIAALDRAGALRITVINVGLLVAVLPVPSEVRVLGWVFVLGAFAAFLPLLGMAIHAWRRVRPDLFSPPMTRAGSL